MGSFQILNHRNLYISLKIALLQNPVLSRFKPPPRGSGRRGGLLDQHVALVPEESLRLKSPSLHLNLC